MFAESERRPEDQIKERNDNHIPGVKIRHMEAGQVPEDLCQIHPLAHEQTDARIDKLRKIKSDDNRQDPPAEKPFQVIRLGLEAFVQSQAAAEQEYRHKQIPDGNKGIHPMYNIPGSMPRRAGLLGHMMQGNSQRGDSQQILCLFQGSIFLIPLSPACAFCAEKKDQGQQKVKQIHPVHVHDSPVPPGTVFSPGSIFRIQYIIRPAEKNRLFPYRPSAACTDVPEYSFLTVQDCFDMMAVRIPGTVSLPAERWQDETSSLSGGYC